MGIIRSLFLIPFNGLNGQFKLSNGLSQGFTHLRQVVSC